MIPIPALLVDLQATGASPAHGHPLELAWALPDAKPDAPPTAHLLALPEGIQIPRPIQRLTGITAELLADALPAAQVIDALRHAARGRVLVAHWARYEQAFLTAHLPDAEWICTYELARRLLPDLPRRGLRAVAGFLGLALPEHKRAAGHVQATALIWRALQPHLAARGVTDLAGLRTLLAEAPPKPGKARYRLPAKVRLALPEGPGVYRMLGKGGEVLYVGKATSLKARVNSYFRGKKGQGARKQEMAQQVWDLDCTECASPLEAALLEADEIKRHAPPYNTALRQRDRRLLFADAAFQAADTPSAAHRWGPVTHAAALAPLAAWIGGAPLELPWPEPVDPAVLADGAALQRARHGDRSVWVVGARLWLERQLASDETADPPQADDSAREASERPWTAERVADALDGAVAHGVHALRRGRVLAALAHAVIRWRPPGHGVDRQIVVDRGVITVGPADGPWPTLAPLDRLGRLQALDIPTWDRLAVLAQVLRIRLRDGLPVEVRRPAHPPLTAEPLHTLLSWVI
ncbi:MAG: GIY-YIG nuclease family protein [Myxococcales bacterium]|nr:GIY-YIG nuclease family protein [Myxococcales bacterium]